MGACLFTAFAFEHTVYSTAGLCLLLLAALLRFCFRPRIYGSIWYIGYALLILWGVTGALAGWAADRSTALAMCKTMCIGAGFVFLLHQLIVQRRNAERSLLVYLLASLAFMLYLAINEREGFLYGRLGYYSNVDPNNVALILSVAFGISFHRLLERKKWYEAIPLPLLATAVLLTGSRKGMALLAIVPAACLLWRDRKHLKRNLILLVALLAALCAAMFLIPSLYETIGERLFALVKALLYGDLSIEGSLNERLSLLRQGWEMFSERPLTGWGFDCYRFNGVTRATYSHNNYLELLVSGGVFALLLYYVPLALVIVRAIRRAGQKSVVQLAVVLVLGHVLMELMFVSYFERPQLALIALLLGISRLAERGGDDRDGTAVFRYIQNPARLFLPFAMRGWFHRMPDEPYLKWMYRAMLGKTPDLDAPKTMNEKLNWMKLHDRDPRYVTISDKYAVRDWIKERVGEQYLVPLLGVWDDPAEIDYAALPQPCVLKTTNDSGGVYFWRAGAKAEDAKNFLRRHLKRDYAALWREWQYREVPPRVIAETYVGDQTGALPVDYKLQCFDGRAFAVQVCTGRESGKPQYWYFDRGLNPLPITKFMEKHPAPQLVFPPCMDEMLAVAEKLSAGFAELRVDLYATADGVKIGELTLFDGAGFFDDYTEAGDLLLGEQLRLHSEGADA